MGRAWTRPGTQADQAHDESFDAWLVTGGCLTATRDARAWWLAARPLDDDQNTTESTGAVTDPRTVFAHLLRRMMPGV